MKKRKPEPIKIHNQNLMTFAGFVATEVTSFFTERSDVLEGIRYQIQNLEENPFCPRCHDVPFTRIKISLSRSFPTVFLDLFFNPQSQIAALVDFNEIKSRKFIVCKYDTKKQEFLGEIDYKNQKFLPLECLKILDEILKKFNESWHKTRPQGH